MGWLFVSWLKCVTNFGRVLHNRAFIVLWSLLPNKQSITAATCYTQQINPKSSHLKNKAKMQAEEYNRRGNGSFHFTALTHYVFVVIFHWKEWFVKNRHNKGWSRNFNRNIVPAVTVSVTAQVRSWWTTSHSTWAPSGRGGWFQMWSQVTWRSFFLTLHLQSRRTGTVSLRTSRKSSCQGWVLNVIHYHICDFKLWQGSEYVLFLSPRWFTGRALICTPTTPVWLRGPRCSGTCWPMPSTVLDSPG